MAPGANIVLAVADTDDSQNIAQVEQEVLPKYPRAIVSQSFGADETGLASDPDAAAIMDKLYLSQVLHGGTVVASSGDFGASNFTAVRRARPSPMAGFPASSPLVLSVGGTMGNPAPDGLWTQRPLRRRAGLERAHAGGRSRGRRRGGAPSVVFAAPPWQQGLTASRCGPSRTSRTTRRSTAA